MNTHPAAQVHPYVVRVFVDLDPAGNPIGEGAICFERGQEGQTLWFDTPGPFDDLADAWTDLVTNYVDRFGQQGQLAFDDRLDT